MLNREGFDLWADGYDKSVRLSEESDTYPFAGYRSVLGEIARRVVSQQQREVLDIGFGTGVLTAKLYEQGCHIYGQDFSGEMIALAQHKMPQARLYQGDFSNGLVPELRQHRYDAIIATYSLHHLTDGQKERFIRELLPLLRDGGCLYIGDVAFATRDELERCRAQAGGEWDDNEIYFVAQEWQRVFPNLEFTPLSACAGVLRIPRA